MKALQTALEIPVAGVDERLSSVDAEEYLAEYEREAAERSIARRILSPRH